MGVQSHACRLDGGLKKGNAQPGMSGERLMRTHGHAARLGVSVLPVAEDADQNMVLGKASKRHGPAGLHQSCRCRTEHACVIG